MDDRSTEEVPSGSELWGTDSAPPYPEPPADGPPAGPPEPDAMTAVDGGDTLPLAPAVSEGVAVPAAPWLEIEAAVRDGFDRMLKAFEAKLAYDATKQTQIDRLHEEVVRHRGNLANRVGRPLVHGLIRLHDDIDKLVGALRAKPVEELTPERFFGLFTGLAEDIEVLLGQNGVAAYREVPGPFDPRRQRILRKVPSSDPNRMGWVAESLRPGFEQGEEILEKERVAIFAYVPEVPGGGEPEGGATPATGSGIVPTGEER